MKVLDDFELKTSANNFGSGGAEFMPEDEEIKARKFLIENAKGKGWLAKKARMALMSPPYNLTCLVVAGKKII